MECGPVPQDRNIQARELLLWAREKAQVEVRHRVAAQDC